MIGGQWIGRYVGLSTGSIVINIDDRKTHYEGAAYLKDTLEIVPATVAHFRTLNKEVPFRAEADLILAFDLKSGFPLPWENVKAQYPLAVMSKRLYIVGDLKDDTLEVTCTSDIASLHAKALLPRSFADQPSKLPSKQMNWQEFKSYVSSLELRKLLFRGQNRPWRLRTSFHRTGRAYLERFIREDVQELHRQLSARTKHIFDLTLAAQNGAFYNLVQHHGYPTPLLDWTYSPYVAAFFAYRGISNRDAGTVEESSKVRIIVFDQAQWRADHTQLPDLVMPGLHVSIQEFPAIENERMIPQQAASTITNVDDMESFITGKSENTLSAIDLPAFERPSVVRELGYMGITAGALFPGLDGACEELKERNFAL